MAPSWQDREVLPPTPLVGVPGICPQGCSQASYLAHFQLPDSSVGTPLQRLQCGLQLPPLPLRHHRGVHSLWPEAGSHCCPPTEPQPLRQGPAGPGRRPHPLHPTLQTDDKLGQLESRRNAGETGRVWGGMGKGTGPGDGGEVGVQLHGRGGPHISESSHVLGQPLSRHHIPAAPTQSLCGCFHLLGQALAYLSGLQGGNSKVRMLGLLFKLKVFKNQHQSSTK